MSKDCKDTLQTLKTYQATNKYAQLHHSYTRRYTIGDHAFIVAAASV